MKLLILVELTKSDGKRVSAEEVADTLCEDIAGLGAVYAQGEDNEDSSCYDLESAKLVEVKAKL